MKHIRSPLEVEILLHYYYARERFPRAGTNAFNTCMSNLLLNNLLKSTSYEDDLGKIWNTYATTNKGDSFVNFICSVPWPIEVFKIPNCEV